MVKKLSLDDKVKHEMSNVKLQLLAMNKSAGLPSYV